MTTPNAEAAGTANSGNGAGAGDAGAGNAGSQGSAGASGQPAEGQTNGQPQGNAGAAADDRYGAPEKYTVPESAKDFEDDLHEDLHKFGKDFNLSDKAMKAVYELAEKRTQRTEQVFKEAHEANVKDWQAKVNADTEIGGEKLAENRAVAAKGLDHFATPEMRALLKESGLENHPEFFRFFFRVGKAVSEDKFVKGGASQNAAAGGLFSYDKSSHN